MWLGFKCGDIEFFFRRLRITLLRVQVTLVIGKGWWAKVNQDCELDKDNLSFTSAFSKRAILKPTKFKEEVLLEPSYSNDEIEAGLGHSRRGHCGKGASAKIYRVRLVAIVWYWNVILFKMQKSIGNFIRIRAAQEKLVYIWNINFCRFLVTSQKPRILNLASKSHKSTS